jgi:hypothetical protein
MATTALRNAQTRRRSKRSRDARPANQTAGLRRWTVAAAIAAIGVGLGACGGSLTASSTCADYVAASPQARDTAVSKIAQDLNAPKAAGLGRPNIDNACVRSPDTTLGTVISRYRPLDASTADGAASEDGVAKVDDSQALELLQTGTTFVPAQETSGFQLDSTYPTGGGTARRLITKRIAEMSQQGVVLPDGVTLDAFSRLLDQALITQTPPGDYGKTPRCLWCKAREISPDDQVEDYYTWIVTFPPADEQPEAYLAKMRNGAS